MRGGRWLKLVFYAIGLVAFCALCWFAGPLISVGDFRPLDNNVMRMIFMGTAALGTFAYVIQDLSYRRRQAVQLAMGLVDGAGGASGAVAAAGGHATPGAVGGIGAPVHDDTPELQTRMNDALATLKQASGSKGNYLYEVPWYVIIGPPGSGKTTALVNSGLKFPLARGATPAAIAGVGGTRYCDWWFTEEAVLIDTAGRYTTQDSDAQSDRRSWLSFLELLKKNRPKQPINGVIVCISIEDILSMQQQDVLAHADAIRTRLIELHDHLKVDFPVYALFTKADLMAGFMEFFGHLNENGRRAVWGATFQTKDKTANMVGEVPAQFDKLIERLNQEVIDRIQEEPTPTARVMLFGFPSQVAALKKPVHDFLNWIFEPTRYHSNATLRGFYFTSGTQQGTPIDQLIGALARSFGTHDVGSVQYSGIGKSYFLSDLLEKVIFGEAGWVSTNFAAVRRAMILRACAYSLLILCTCGAAAAWWFSYNRNSGLIGETYSSVTQYKTIAAALRDESVVSDRDFARVLPALHYLRNMPVGYAYHDVQAPTLATFGLNQRPRLNVSAESAYDTALLRLFRPRLLYRMEERIRANIANAGFLTEALKIYLMLGGKEAMDKKRVMDWWQDDWSENLFPGAGNAPGRQALGEHLSRLLQIDSFEGPSAIEVDPALIQEAQSAIGRMSVADRAFEILRSSARSESARDWTVRRKGGQDVALVFEGAKGVDLESIRVPFFYTYTGFQEAFLAKITEVTGQVRQERKLLGDVAAQSAVAAQYDTLPQALLDRYSREFIATWRNELNKLRIKLLTADKPRYQSLQAAAAPTSPIVQLIESIRDETSLTKEKPASSQPAGQPAKPPSAAPTFALPSGEAPGAQVEAAFRTYQLLADGDRGRRPIDDLLKSLSDVYTALTMLNDPVRSAQGKLQFSEGLRTLEATATRFPDPFKSMIQTASGAFDGDATGTQVARIYQALGEQVTRTCQQTVTGLYPFSRGSDKDLSVQEFQRLFSPSGVIDRFFTANLAQLVDTSKPTWTWNAANPVARQLQPGMLQGFQRAAEIRQAFFPAGAPSFSFAVKNLSIGESADLAKLEINSGVLTTERPKPPPAPSISIFGSSPPPPPPPPQQPQVVIFQWPGPVGMSAAAISLQPDIPGRSSVLQKSGVWGLFRLLDGANVSRAGEALIARFNVGGREVQYQLNVTSLPNPFTLTALRDFRCPASQ